MADTHEGHHVDHASCGLDSLRFRGTKRCFCERQLMNR
jgi:hypothetical protein